MSKFEIELDVYATHIRHETGYSAGEATLMINGFGAGWVAHRDVASADLAAKDATIERFPFTTRAVSLFLREEWGVQWDGEPKMGGGFHICSIGTTWPTEQEAREACSRASLARRPGFRIVHRMVSDWQ